MGLTEVLLREVLEEARSRGLLGPGPVAEHLGHSRELARLAGPAPATFLDLGSGGGVPGLVLAVEWPEARGILVDSHQRSGRFLEEAVAVLELADRVRVRLGRAEKLAHDPELRGTADVVVARSFGPPAVAAECAAGFLRPGGRLVVSEPPDAGAERWPAKELAQLGLGPAEIRRGTGASVAALELVEPPADRWPRRPGIPEKRPLW
jgi:16S rRNA (guanine527-N7)-methyltransferase